MVSDEEIRKLAYEIWEQEGRLPGMDVEHFFKAKQILEEREAKRVLELAPVPARVELAGPPEKMALPAPKRKRATRRSRK
jgi:hypothetical protein